MGMISSSIREARFRHVSVVCCIEVSFATRPSALLIHSTSAANNLREICLSPNHSPQISKAQQIVILGMPPFEYTREVEDDR